MKTRPANRGKTGRSKPPTEHQFKPGQSGNPSGRPKTRPLTEALRAVLEEVDPKKKKTVAHLIAQALIREARRGKRAAFQEIADRIEGRPTQRIEHSGPEGGAIPVSLEDLDARLAELIKEIGSQQGAARAKS